MGGREVGGGCTAERPEVGGWGDREVGEGWVGGRQRYRRWEGGARNYMFSTVVLMNNTNTLNTIGTIVIMSLSTIGMAYS